LPTNQTSSSVLSPISRYKLGTLSKEASLQKAVQVARQQHARSCKLRSVTSLAGLWQKQGRTEQARHLLTGVYAWFTEGFETPDLLKARELLSRRE
jgi:predicted ATPase